jgi:hypothetical protein
MCGLFCLDTCLLFKQLPDDRGRKVHMEFTAFLFCINNTNVKQV